MTLTQEAPMKQANDALADSSPGLGATKSKYSYSNSPMGKPRPIRIVVVGAGVSGIAAVKLFKDKFSGKPVELAVYDKNHDVGGTWLENRYPGCACDVPAQAYNYSWEGNPNWSHAYVGSLELFDWYKSRAKAYGVYDHLKLNHTVESAVWNASSGQWEITIRDTLKDQTFVDKAEVLINAAGFLNKWKWPEIEGLNSFKGHLAHSAHWDTSYDYKDKTVAVIGSGSSAIQIVPELQPIVKQLISFNRSATWITPEFAAEFAPQGRDTEFSAEQKAEWASNPSIYKEYRKKVESSMNGFFDLQYKNGDGQKQLVETITKAMTNRLQAKPELAEVLIPKFAVGCRRITPGHMYLESLSQDNTTVETEGILKITPDGLETQSGKKYNVDVIVCATGFDTSFRPPFSLIGPDKKDLRDVWKDEPRSYLSVAASGFPNYFISAGPNFPLANGTLIPCLEKCIEYAYKAVEKLQSHGVKALHPKAEAVDDFQEHKDAMMEDLVWTSGCRSWYKSGTVDGKVWGPWCGSSIHFLELMDQPRWEDWEFQYTTSNRFQFLGNGRTEREQSGGDLAYYIQEAGAA